MSRSPRQGILVVNNTQTTRLNLMIPPPSAAGVTTEVVVKVEVAAAVSPSFYLGADQQVESQVQFTGNSMHSVPVFRSETINKNS